ncbi:hypothetical protein K1T71_007005 [Dendrolimus kikuchii]|uniref:Uncharacterized protein n=1 Tax=Dendrolimus kikuchii TaxID=765133 RepID=A0ACC1CZH2_9NEOP|nr:hypothetical protein K1T71_007005 [Dendrolimus kikuchii]
MEESFENTIEKIKLMEHDQEAKLKQKREYELAISSLNKALKDISLATEKCIQEYTVSTKKVNALQHELFIAKIRREALVSTLTTFTEELSNLKKQSYDGVHAVWNLRSDLCTMIQQGVDEYDIRALLVKPKHSDMGNPDPKTRCTISPVLLDEGRLKLAIEKRDKAIAERTRLFLEPDNGKEFTRIKNALNYSMQRINK